MQLGAMLDLMIGLCFMFFLLSLIASSLQEIVAGVFKWRGTYLAKALDVILDNKPDAAFKFAGIGDWLRAHFTSAPGRSVLQQYHLDIHPQVQKRAFGMGAPVQVPPQQEANPVLARVLGVQAHPLIRSTPSTLPSYVPAGNFSQALLGVLRDGSQAPLFSQVQTTVAALPDGDLKTTLTLFVQDAEGDIDALRARLEKWFDDAMDRVQGIYKRLAQYSMLILGLGLAIALNVNTPHVAAVLYRTPSLRNTLEAQASAAVTQGSTAESSKNLRGLLADFEDAELPIGWDCKRVPAPGSRLKSLSELVGASPDVAAAAPADDTAEGGAQVVAENKSAACGKLFVAPPSAWLRPNWGMIGIYGAYSWHSLLGWIVTGFAVSFGAPFWFDLLQNLVNLRSAGKEPPRGSAPGG